MKETDIRRKLAEVIWNLRREGKSSQIFNRHKNSQPFRIYVASYLLGVTKGLGANEETTKQIERIIGILDE